jgi:hypothetical protein
MCHSGFVAAVDDRCRRRGGATLTFIGLIDLCVELTVVVRIVIQCCCMGDMLAILGILECTVEIDIDLFGDTLSDVEAGVDDCATLVCGDDEPVCLSYTAWGARTVGKGRSIYTGLSS